MPACLFPAPFLTYAENGGLGAVSPRDLDRNRKDNYVAAWTASVQQTLPGKILGTASYMGNKGTDVLTTTYTNLAAPGTNVVPYPAFGAVSWRGDVGNSTFEALQVNVRRPLQNGLLLSANYMWSHSINDGSIGGGESDTPKIPFAGLATKAIRTTMSGTCLTSPPFISFLLALESVISARRALPALSWELGTERNRTTQTGLPVNVTVDRTNASVPGMFAIGGSMRPNYVAGVALTPAGGSTPAEWINPAAFAKPADQTFGNLGRNAFRFNLAKNGYESHGVWSEYGKGQSGVILLRSWLGR